MSRLSEFLGKPKEITIDGKKLLIHPLKAKHLDLFMKEDINDEEKAKASKKIVKLSLLPSISDITDEEINNMDMKVFNEVLFAAIEVNGMKEDERIRKIKEKIIQAKSKGK